MSLAAKRGRERGSLGAWLIGSLALLGMLFVLLGDFPWPWKLGAWVLLTLILDECGGWFGYTGALAGAAPLLAPALNPLLAERAVLAGPAPEWFVVFPLVVVGLLGLLLVKHTGGLPALPLALAAFVLPILLARFVAPQLDATVTLPASRTLFDWALWPAVIGVGLAVVRRFVLPERRTA